MIALENFAMCNKVILFYLKNYYKVMIILYVLISNKYKYNSAYIIYNLAVIKIFQISPDVFRNIHIYMMTLFSLFILYFLRIYLL